MKDYHQASGIAEVRCKAVPVNPADAAKLCREAVFKLCRIASKSAFSSASAPNPVPFARGLRTLQLQAAERRAQVMKLDLQLCHVFPQSLDLGALLLDGEGQDRDQVLVQHVLVRVLPAHNRREDALQLLGHKAVPRVLGFRPTAEGEGHGPELSENPRSARLHSATDLRLSSGRFLTYRLIERQDVPLQPPIRELEHAIGAPRPMQSAANRGILR